VLKQVSDTVTITTTPQTMDVYAAAVELAAVYRLDVWAVLDELRRVYPSGEVPLAHVPDLARQIEDLTRNYVVREETVEVALALVKPEGFEKSLDADGAEVYTAEITYPIEREHLLVSWEQMKAKNEGGYGFHYTPYNFDSQPEFSFFEQLLECLNLHPSEVEDIYFTGAITTPDKTDFYVEYWGEDDRWHRYTPDFVIRKKNGKCYIVEIKDEGRRADPVEGEDGRKAMATRKWVGLNPERLKYEMVFAKEEMLSYDQTQKAREFVTS